MQNVIQDGEYKRAWLYVGSPNADVRVIGNLEFLPGALKVHAGEADIVVPYREDNAAAGKVTACEPLSWLASVPHDDPVNGGGVRNSVAEAAVVPAGLRWCRLVALDAAQPWPLLTEEYAAWGVEHISLGLEPAAINAVFVDQAARTIIRSPVTPARLTPEQEQALRAALPDDLAVVTINSPKSDDLARVALQAAMDAGVDAYACLTPGASLQLRLELLAGCRACTCNLAEFAQIARPQGVPCPVNERRARLSIVASAMLKLANLLPTGDFVVTLGARGCLVFVRATMSVWLVALRKARASLVQAHLRPERINGTGDAFLTEFVAGHAHFCRAAGRPAVAAALAASVTMAHRLAPSLPAEESWFDVRPLAGKDQCA